VIELEHEVEATKHDRDAKEEALIELAALYKVIWFCLLLF